MSTPLIQFLLPYPGSFFQRFSFFQTAQQNAGTNWEALAAVPIASFLLFQHFVFFTAGRERRFMLLLPACAAFIYSLGPFLQLSTVVSADTTLRLPLLYLIDRLPIFSFFRAPGRMHVLLFLIILTGSGHLLHQIRPVTDKLHAAIWPALLFLVMAINLAWCLPSVPVPTFPTPRVPAFYTELGKKQGTGAVLDAPIDYFACARYNFYQFEHKRPTVSSVLYHDAHTWDSTKFLQTRPPLLFFTGMNSAWGSEENISRILSADFMKDLAAHHIEYIVIHDQLLNYLAAGPNAHPDTLRLYERIEAGWADRLIYRDDLIRVYSTASSE